MFVTFLLFVWISEFRSARGSKIVVAVDHQSITVRIAWRFFFLVTLIANVVYILFSCLNFDTYYFLPDLLLRSMYMYIPTVSLCENVLPGEWPFSLLDSLLTWLSMWILFTL